MVNGVVGDGVWVGVGISVDGIVGVEGGVEVVVGAMLIIAVSVGKTTAGVGSITGDASHAANNISARQIRIVLFDRHNLC
jgi:hypothetical protein